MASYGPFDDAAGRSRRRSGPPRQAGVVVDYRTTGGSAPHPPHDPAQGRRPGEGRQQRLGHSSLAFTMTVYQHVLPGMQADAARAFSAAVFGDVGEASANAS
jgi:hypothetical protein